MTAGQEVRYSCPGKTPRRHNAPQGPLHLWIRETARSAEILGLHCQPPHPTRQMGGSSTEIRLRDLAERPLRARKAEASGEPWTPRRARCCPRSSRGLLHARKDQEIRDMSADGGGH